MWHFFRRREVLRNLRKDAGFFVPPARSPTHGTNSAHFRGIFGTFSPICNQLPRSKKSSKSIIKFKTNLKQFGNIDCGCVICRK